MFDDQLKESSMIAAVRFPFQAFSVLILSIVSVLILFYFALNAHGHTTVDATNWAVAALEQYLTG